MLVALLSVLRLADCVDACTEVGWICICSDAGCIDACVDVMCSDDCIDVSCGAGVSEGIDLLLKAIRSSVSRRQLFVLNRCERSNELIAQEQIVDKFIVRKQFVDGIIVPKQFVGNIVTQKHFVHELIAGKQFIGEFHVAFIHSSSYF